jgi:hypothetical protein
MRDDNRLTGRCSLREYAAILEALEALGIVGEDETAEAVEALLDEGLDAGVWDDS